MDSLDICQYAFEKRDSIKATILPSDMIVKLRKLLARRDFMVRQRQSLKVSLKEQKGFIEAGIYNSLKSGNDRLIEAYNTEIKSIEQSIREVIESDPQIARNDELARSVIGIGEITSAYMIATTENFKVFNNARKYACYCGVAPFPNQSGIRRGKTKVSPIANKKMKSLFSNCILSAISNDPEIAKYYERKKEEGKRPGIVFNAIKNKLIHRVFAVIDRQTPYVKMLNYI